MYQIEVQVVLHEAMPERMLLTWARLYNRQLKRGQPYSMLLPVTSIWILDRRLEGNGRVHRWLALRDGDGVPLTSHCNLHILDLANLDGSIPNGPLEDWLYFLKNARDWTELPAVLDRGVMKEAMGVMKRFSEDDVQYYRYIAELDAETVEITRQASMRNALAKLAAAEGALRDKTEQLATKDEQLATKDEQLARLEALLRSRSLDSP